MDDDPVLLFNPAISSVNLGDHVIADSARSALSPFLSGRYVIDISTHLGLSWNFMRILYRAPWKIVLGSNLLRGRMNGLFRQWDITPASAPIARGSILMGVGWWQYRDQPNLYTSRLYRYVLNRELTHSVRDHHTQQMLAKTGVTNVVVTGCPSLWPLTEEHCATIPTTAGSVAVTTLTDYSRADQADRDMLDLLVSRYDRVRVWAQGMRDVSYLRSLGLGDGIEIIDPTLAAFDEALSDPEVDYLGTRLHAGIRALQHGRRSAIISIDNRANEMSKSFGLPILHRGDHEALSAWCQGSDPVRLDLPWDAISAWRAQFPER